MKNILRMTTGAAIDGLIYFRLGLWAGTQEVAHWAVNSGQAGAQHLRTYEDKFSIPGNMEPIPEGVYPISGLIWAGEPGDYETYWSSALGPVLVDIYAKGDNVKGYRGAFRVHLDANRSSAPGTAGCPGIVDLEDLKEFVAAIEEFKPVELVVDYGLGTAPGAPGKTSTKPTVKARSKTESKNLAEVTLDGVAIGKAEIREGTTYPTLSTLAAILGFGLEWKGSSKTAALTRPKQ